MKSQHFPSPWTLYGNAYMILYKFKKAFVEKNINLKAPFANNFKGGFGCLMLVDYQKADCGAYKELLLIPGQFKVGQHQLYSISDILVSTLASVENGRKNWGIPKELADFEIQSLDKKTEKIIITQNNEPVLETVISAKGISFPISTKLFSLKIIQEWDNQQFITSPKSKGKGQLANIQSLKINDKLFPDISQIKPLAAIKVSNFQMTFPKPQVL
jgi:hypothetical protein